MDKYSANSDYYNRNTVSQNQTRQNTQAQTQLPAAQRQLPITSEGLTPGAPQSMTPTTMESTYYLAGLMTTFIGSRVRVQFLVGTTGPLIDIVGTLRQVGANYIIIQPIETDDLMICDLYSIKFTTVYR
jgi:hypothetical protein